jgi:hypothetical protein
MVSSGKTVGGTATGEAVIAGVTGSQAIARARVRQTSPISRRYDFIIFIASLH